MARTAPKGRASTRVPAQFVSTGPSKKPAFGEAKMPPPAKTGNKRTSDKPIG